MWFKKKKEGVKESNRSLEKDIRKEEERVRKLLSAYEILINDGTFNRYMRSYADEQKEIALKVFSIPDDLEAAQTALTLLWDAYEMLEGKNMERPGRLSEQVEEYLRRATKLDQVRCYNCLSIYKGTYSKCPKCSASR